jgi:hypothetical protein
VIAGTTFGSQLSYLRPQKKAGQVASSRVASASAESTGAASTVPQAPEADDTKLSAALTGPISERFVYETLRSNPRGPLSLQDQRLSRETFKSLSLYPFLAAVELRDCTGLTNEVVKQLSSLPLVELDLSQTDITKKGAKDMIEAAKAWPKTLKILKFNSTEIDDDTCDSLPRLRAMNELVLKNTKITNTSLQKICQLPMLKKLALDNTNISTLENIEKLQSLSELYLSGTQVRMTNLLKLRDLPKLRILKLVHCPQLSSSDLARVREMLPKCQVTTESNGRELDKLRRASELLN